MSKFFFIYILRDNSRSAAAIKSGNKHQRDTVCPMEMRSSLISPRRYCEMEAMEKAFSLPIHVEIVGV